MKLLPAFGLAILLGWRAFGEQSGGVDTAIYDPDPAHLWNRLNETLFLRTAQDGKRYGLDRVDILFWNNTKYLLTEPSHGKALAVLDEFIKTNGEKLVRDPLKRALLQRDLWQLFDWTAGNPSRPENVYLSPAELQRRLATVIRRLALTPAEIASLPDNYAQADASRSRGDLPHGLFQKTEGWVTVGVNGDELTAPRHVRDFGGRSVFFVMIRHPKGSKAAVSYLEQLRAVERPGTHARDPNEDKSSPRLTPDLPQFPANTVWALVRRMCVINTKGEIAMTPITESIQVRRYLKIPGANARFSSGPVTNAFENFEFILDRRQKAVLRLVGRDETDFLHVQFLTMGIDSFEWKSQRSEDPPPDSAKLKRKVMSACVTCHSSAGIGSVLSYTRAFGPRLDSPPALSDLDPAREADMTINWKRRQYDWGLLQGLWLQAN